MSRHRMKVDIRQPIWSGSQWRETVETPTLYALGAFEASLTRNARALNTSLVFVAKDANRTTISGSSVNAIHNRKKGGAS